MTRFLAIVRRAFLYGTISLLLCLLVVGVKLQTMWDVDIALNSSASAFSIFFALSPVLYLLLTIITVSYVRNHGQFAEVHRARSRFATFFKCVWSDFSAPLKNLVNFFKAIFSKHVIGRARLIIRFVEMVIIILLCIYGISTLV